MVCTFTGVGLQTLTSGGFRYSFLVFFVSNALWFSYGVANKDRPVYCTQAALLALNVIGTVRYFNLI